MASATLLSCAQKDDSSSIKQVIESFAKAGDNNDAKKLENLLDQHYQIHMNQLFGSTELSIVDRDLYLQKIESKEWGGDKRFVEIDHILMNGNSAVVMASLKGSKSTFKSIFILIKNKDGKWLLLSDTPEIVG
jgi:ketosteroid isomerase-like protein